jgi:uncharacterized beta-barrel protein YwiB (DUF1934 family)
MKKIRVFFEIISMESKTRFDTDGEYKDNRLRFIDPEGDINYIICKENIVEYYKKGTVDMKYIFNLDLVTKGYYGIHGNRFDFQIVTHILTIDEDEIYVKYDLYQSEDLVNKTELRIGCKYKEES